MNQNGTFRPGEGAMRRLKEIRDAHGLTQEEAARRVGANRENWVKWENGTRAVSVAMVIKIADYFNVDVNYLLGYDNPNIYLHTGPFLDLTEEQKAKVNQALRDTEKTMCKLLRGD